MGLPPNAISGVWKGQFMSTYLNPVNAGVGAYVRPS